MVAPIGDSLIPSSRKLSRIFVIALVVIYLPFVSVFF